MPKKPREKVSPVVTTDTRLARIEELVLDMRLVLDVHVKRMATLQTQVERLIEKARVK